MKNKVNYRKILLIIMIVNVVIFNLYYAFALFVTKQVQENVSSINTVKDLIKIESFDLTNNSFHIDFNDKKTITMKLINDNDFDVYYQLLHSKNNAGIKVYSDDSVNGLLRKNSSISVDVSVNNDSDKIEKISFYVQSSLKEINYLEDGYSYINSSENYDHTGANKPNMKDINGIPVYYNEKDGYWYKTDINNKDSIWYDYDNQIWANIVLVNDDIRSYYMDSNIGTKISEDDVTSYLVWIPKFRYVINSSVTNYENLNKVYFEKNSLGTLTCSDSISNEHLYSEKCSDNTNGKIMDGVSTYSHPAFKDVTGFWVSKFEVSDNRYSLPNKMPSKENLNDAITYSRLIETSDVDNGIVGGSILNDDGTIVDDNNSVDSHLLTNSEWGSIIILYNSRFGKSGNSNYYHDNVKTFSRMYINSNGYTGCSSVYTINSSSFNFGSNNTCVMYNDMSNYTHNANSTEYNIYTVGPGASTTGTIYGVYDMAGGESELVSAVVVDSNNNLPISNYSGYYDVYSNNGYKGIINSYNDIKYLSRYKYGDGTKEFYRVFDDNSLWNTGYLKQDSVYGVITRGGDKNSFRGASIYSSNVVDINEKLAYRFVIK